MAVPFMPDADLGFGLTSAWLSELAMTPFVH